MDFCVDADPVLPKGNRVDPQGIEGNCPQDTKAKDMMYAEPVPQEIYIGDPQIIDLEDILQDFMMDFDIDAGEALLDGSEKNGFFD